MKFIIGNYSLLYIFELATVPNHLPKVRVLSDQVIKHTGESRL